MGCRKEILITSDEVVAWPFRESQAKLICHDAKPYLLEIGELRMPFDEKGDAEGNTKNLTYGEFQAKFLKPIASPLEASQGLYGPLKPFIIEAERKCE